MFLSAAKFWFQSVLLFLAVLGVSLTIGCGGSGSGSSSGQTQSDQVTVAAPQSGQGTITSSPAGINCPGTCSATFDRGTSLTLTAMPATNYYFSGWSGACSGNTPCTLTVNGSEHVSASFAAGNSLTVTTTGTGTGTVSSSPAGINCTSGSTTGCSAAFAPGTSVTLSETASTPNQFSGWSGACSGTGPCSVTLAAASNTVGAAFAGGTIKSLNHIILFVQENRSFDHYFGYLRQYWATNGTPDQSFDGLPQFNPVSGAAPLQGPAPSVPGCDPAEPFIPGDPTTGVPAQNTACILDGNSPKVTSFHMQSVCTEELSPFWNESRDDWNAFFLWPSTVDPEMNGFVKAAADDARQYPVAYNDDTYVNDSNGLRSMGYFTDADLNYYYFMATQFATSDRWFAPVMSRTQLNRAYIIGATSQGYAYPPGSNANDNAPFSATPIFKELQAAGVTWRVYVDPNSSDPTNGVNCAAVTGAEQNKCLADVSYINEFTYEGVIQADPTLYQNFVPTTQFATDLQNDATFPQVAMIEPPSDSGLDEHPSDRDAYPENVQQGAKYAASLINTFMSSPTWKDSALIFTYDESGGFYDHVPAQPVPAPDMFTYPKDLEANDKCDGANQSTGICSFAITGFRVPVIIISPFAKKNYVSHTVRDTTAWLNLVEERFGVPALTARDAFWGTTTPLATMDEFFDFVNVPWATPPTPPAQNTSGACTMAAPTP